MRRKSRSWKCSDMRLGRVPNDYCVAVARQCDGMSATGRTDSGRWCRRVRVAGFNNAGERGLRESTCSSGEVDVWRKGLWRSATGVAGLSKSIGTLNEVSLDDSLPATAKDRLALPRVSATAKPERSFSAPVTRRAADGVGNCVCAPVE